MMRFGRVAAALFLLFALNPVSTAASVASRDAAAMAVCRPFYRNACSEAMGRWLPERFGFSWTWRKAARHLSAFEHFDYGSASASVTKIMDVPSDGTFFVYGEAGPPKGNAVYDQTHRIALYSQGCCSWRETVLAANAPAPPRQLVARNLSRVATSRGITLGMRAADVIRIDGPTASQNVVADPHVRVLSYLYQEPKASAGCGDDEDFFVRNDRVIAIVLAWAC